MTRGVASASARGAVENEERESDGEGAGAMWAACPRWTRSCVEVTGNGRTTLASGNSSYNDAWPFGSECTGLGAVVSRRVSLPITRTDVYKRDADAERSEYERSITINQHPRLSINHDRLFPVSVVQNARPYAMGSVQRPARPHRICAKRWSFQDPNSCPKRTN